MSKYQEVVGFKRKRGKPAIGEKPSKPELKRLYVKESRSIREVADILGCSKDMVYRSLQEYEIDRRAGIKRSRLKDHRPEDLKRRSKQEGISKVAENLGVPISTLKDYIKK